MTQISLFESIFSVSEALDLFQGLVNIPTIKVEGEISELKFSDKAVYLSLKDELANVARSIRLNAVNHREFYVCSVILTYSAKQGYRFSTGVNLMPLPKPGPKVCAEQGALSHARSQRPDLIVAIVVCGLPQTDGESGRDSPTLHPCGNCRKIFEGLPEITEDTIIYTVSPDQNGPTEEQAFKKLLEYHNHVVAA